jgi:hypothetical protein
MKVMVLGQPRRWANDYGDIPWWYWTVFHDLRVLRWRREERGRVRARAVLGMCLGLAARAR